MPVRRYGRRGGVALAALVAAFALLGGCGGMASRHVESAGTPDAADPVGRTTPAARTNLDCQPTSTPVSPTPARAPRIVRATAVDCAVAPGGAPARFQVTVANPTGKAYERAGLTFSYGYSAWGDDPNALRIDYRHGDTWTRLPMHWTNPDEPELVESGAMHVDLPPRSTTTYDVRFALPTGYVPEAGVVSFGGGVILDLPGESRQRHANSVRGPVFALDPPRGTPVNLNLPGAVRPGGGPVEFAAEVDNSTGRAYDRTALDLRIYGVADDRTTFEVFRDGGWHPVALRTSADHVVGTIADGPTVPAGYRHTYRLRIRLLPGAVRTGGANPRVSLRLRDLAAKDADLGTAERLLHVVLPTVHVQLPKEIRAPGAVEFPLSLENVTGVRLPPVQVRLTVTNPPTRDGLTVAYRPAGLPGPWTSLPVGADADGSHAWTAELPPPRSDGTPAGLRASYDVRIELAKWNAETGNLLHVAALLVLDDGSPVSASTEGDPANAYIGVRSD